MSRNIFDAFSTPEFSPLCPQSQRFLAHRKACPNSNPKIITWHPRVPPGLAGGFGEPGRGPEAGRASLEGSRQELGESPKVTCPLNAAFCSVVFPPEELVSLFFSIDCLRKFRYKAVERSPCTVELFCIYFQTFFRSDKEQSQRVCWGFVGFLGVCFFLPPALALPPRGSWGRGFWPPLSLCAGPQLSGMNRSSLSLIFCTCFAWG